MTVYKPTPVTAAGCVLALAESVPEFGYAELRAAFPRVTQRSLSKAVLSLTMRNRIRRIAQGRYALIRDAVYLSEDGFLIVMYPGTMAIFPPAIVKRIRKALG